MFEINYWRFFSAGCIIETFTIIVVPLMFKYPHLNNEITIKIKTINVMITSLKLIKEQISIEQ